MTKLKVSFHEGMSKEYIEKWYEQRYPKLTPKKKPEATAPDVKPKKEEGGG